MSFNYYTPVFVDQLIINDTHIIHTFIVSSLLIMTKDDIISGSNYQAS